MNMPIPCAHSMLRLGLTLAAILLLATPARAGVLDASWTEPTLNVDGSPLTDLSSYRVYFGPGASPCPGSSFMEVAASGPSPAPNQTVAHRLTGLSTGVSYYVSVTAVSGSGNESACVSPAPSAVAVIDFAVSPTGTTDFGTAPLGDTADRTFTVTNTGGGTVSGTVSTSAPFSIVSGSPFSLAGVGATRSIVVRFSPTVAATATVNMTFTANGGSLSRVVTGTGSPATSTPPAVAITTPTSASTYGTSSTSLTLGGTATASLPLTAVTWTNSRGGSGTATGTTSWAAGPLLLQPGVNVLTVTARDTAGATATDSVTVTVDTTLPTVAMTAPTSSASYTTRLSPLTLAGTASDNIGVTRVTWSNSRGGTGTATGTTTWSASGIVLQPGTNVLTVTARDAAGNIATARVTVTFDANVPTIVITTPTSSTTYRTRISPVTLGGTASDDIGVTAVTWTNNRGGSGTAVGTTSWTAGGIVLQPGSNVLRVTTRDGGGNTAADTVTVIFDATAPKITITSPTSASTYSTRAAALTLRGTASDNIGVTRVTWTNTRGGGGTATGTTSWTISGIVLQPGDNTLRVTARDAAGNTTTDAVTVALDTTPPTVALTAPKAGTTVAGTISVTATATDDVRLAGVQFKIDGANLGAEVKVAPYAVAWSTITIADGAHALTAVARDAAGNTATSAAVLLAVANHPTGRLIAHWKLDEGAGTTTTDASGRGHTGNLVNGPVWTAGKLGQALTFDGHASSVTVASTPALNTYPLTLAFWVKAAPGASGGIVNKYVAGSAKGYQVMMNDGQLCAWYFKDAQNYVGDTSECPLGVSGHADGQWHRVVFIVNAAGGALHVDGVLRASKAWIGLPGATATPEPLHLGVYPAPAGDWNFAGAIDDVLISSGGLSAVEGAR